MADQNLDQEVEDVLSSIRRLVSHTPEVRAEARIAPKPAEDKLVLTHAQRVEEPDLTDLAPESVWSLEDRIAELEAAVGASPDEWEPDGSEDVEQETPRQFVFQHRPLRDVIEPEVPVVVDEPLDAEDPDAETTERPDADPVSGDEPDVVEVRVDHEPVASELDLTADISAVDPDALRDLVAEIVRQELRGELGERVTRNIRKLVRREIHRALMSREFD